MPYITSNQRAAIAAGTAPLSSGELNYCISKLLASYWTRNHSLGYQAINDILGALEGAKLEFVRRVANPYEDEAIKRNGDLY